MNRFVPRFKSGQILYDPKGKTYVEVQSYEVLDQLYCCKLLSSKSNKNSGFGLVFFKEKQLIPATDLGKAIFL